ncbi:MAG: hypothetical protein WCF18_06595, partial [Chthoniobacteraceae bacterium]
NHIDPLKTNIRESESIIKREKAPNRSFGGSWRGTSGRDFSTAIQRATAGTPPFASIRRKRSLSERNVANQARRTSTTEASELQAHTARGA